MIVFIRIIIIRIGRLVFLGGAALAAEEMAVERLDSALDKLIPADAKIEVLAEGFKWSKEPAWNAKTENSFSPICRTT